MLKADNTDARNKADILALRVQEAESQIAIARQSESKALEALAYVRWMLAGRLPGIMPAPPLKGASGPGSLALPLLRASLSLSCSAGGGASMGRAEEEDDDELALVEAARLAGSVAGDMLGVCALWGRITAESSAEICQLLGPFSLSLFLLLSSVSESSDPAGEPSWTSRLVWGLGRRCRLLFNCRKQC